MMRAVMVTMMMTAPGKYAGLWSDGHQQSGNARDKKNAFLHVDVPFGFGGYQRSIQKQETIVLQIPDP